MFIHNKKLLILSIILLLIGGGVYFFKKNIGSVSIPSENDVLGNVDTSNLKSLSYLKVPDGFGISIFAKDVPDARTMLLTGKGVLVTETKQGKIILLEDTDNDGVADSRRTIIDNLDKPHGLATWGEGGQNYLYVAERNKLSRYNFDNLTDKDVAYNGQKLIDLPSSVTDRHFSRSLMWLPSNEPDGYSNTLLISVGSSCNVCYEENQKQGTVLSYNIVTKKLDTYATGLRNAVFMTPHPVTGKIWATEMGRDGLGDNTPPDEINIIEKGKNYGWPLCYGKNIHDTDFDIRVYVSETAKFRQPCTEPFEIPSYIDLQAHSAPLGLDFISEEGWPEEYWYNALVAYHGSWNRSVPTGYKIVRIKLDSKGKYLGTEDFITGWLDKNGKKIGRPVDIKLSPGGTGYISDDEAGVIYRLYKIQE